MKISRKGVWIGRIMTAGVLASALAAVVVSAQPQRKAVMTNAPARDDTSAMLLLAAVRAGDEDSVRKLVLSGVDVNAALEHEGSALIVAARTRNLDMAKELLLLGADVKLAVRGDGNPLMAAAATADNGPLIEHFIAAGSDVNAVVLGDETPLINAARSGSLENVKALVNRGANVNLAVNSELGVRRSPLNQAKGPAIRDYLVAQGAKP